MPPKKVRVAPVRAFSGAAPANRSSASRTRERRGRPPERTLHARVRGWKPPRGARARRPTAGGVRRASPLSPRSRGWDPTFPRALGRQIPPPRARDSNGNGLSSIDLRAPPATRLTRFAPRPPFSQAKKGKSEPAADAFDEPTTRVLKPENQLDVAAVARAVNVEKLQKKLGPKFSDLGGGDPSEHEKLVDEMTTPTEEDITKVLEEEVTRQLTANNPNAPSNIARYSSKERVFSFEPVVDQLVMHFAMDGFLIHQDSDDAKRQIQLEEIEAQVMATGGRGQAQAQEGRGRGGERAQARARRAGRGGRGGRRRGRARQPAEPHDDSKGSGTSSTADRASRR